MSLTLQEIRDYIYLHLELDEDDLPAALIDTWATEGFLRILKVVRRWPHFQQATTVNTVASQQTYNRADEFAGMRTVMKMSGPQGELRNMHHQDATEQFFRTGAADTVEGQPVVWSEWGDVFYFWPRPDAEYSITVYGWRLPVMFGTDVGSEPDLPEAFHQLVRSWTLYRAHLHQDDTELAEIEKVQFTEILDMMISEETRDDGSGPMIYGGCRKTFSYPRELRADYTTWT